MAEDKKIEEKPKEKTQLTKQELTVLIHVINQPHNQDLQTAGFLIQINNKLSHMIDEVK